MIETVQASAAGGSDPKLAVIKCGRTRTTGRDGEKRLLRLGNGGVFLVETPRMLMLDGWMFLFSYGEHIPNSIHGNPSLRTGNLFQQLSEISQYTSIFDV